MLVLECKELGTIDWKEEFPLTSFKDTFGTYKPLWREKDLERREELSMKPFFKLSESGREGMVERHMYIREGDGVCLNHELMGKLDRFTTTQSSNMREEKEKEEEYRS